MTSPWLIDLQLKVLDIIDKHGLQELTYCTICGLASGSEYRLNKGNMFISSVHGGIYGDQPRRFSYIDTSIMYLREYESYFSVDSYHNLYDSAIPYESWLSIDVMEKVVKRMFKGTKTRGTIFIKKEKNHPCQHKNRVKESSQQLLFGPFHRLLVDLCRRRAGKHQSDLN